MQMALYYGGFGGMSLTRDTLEGLVLVVSGHVFIN